MKNLINKFFCKLINKVINKSVTEAVNATEVHAVIEPADVSNKNLWKFILQTLISILTAILTALGTTSCMALH